MGASDYIKNLHGKIGPNELLLLPGVCALVFNDAGEILLQRSDTGKWAVIGGMPEPGEEPAQTAVREVMEECGIIVQPVRISGVYSTPIVTYPNGDRAQYIITTFVCKPVSGEPRVNDDESLEVRYFPLDSLPELKPNHRLRIEHAIANSPGAFFKPPNA
jgi:8-oxo-dGTP diphosphatase